MSRPSLEEVEAKYGTRPRIPMGHGEPMQVQHFRGEMADGSKFVYCPVGFIVSWLADDYAHKYCAWCHEFYEDVDHGHSKRPV